MTATPLLTENVAGPFTLTWAAKGLAAISGSTISATAVTLGVIGDKGIKEIRRYNGEEISADLLGAEVDATYLGSRMFLEFNLEEPNREAVHLMSHPFVVPAADTIAGAMAVEGEYGIPGMFFTDYYGELVATPAFGITSAGAQSTPTRTYRYCTLAPGWELAKLLSSRRRVVPIRLAVWPYLNSVTSSYRFYDKT